CSSGRALPSALGCRGEALGCQAEAAAAQLIHQRSVGVDLRRGYLDDPIRSRIEDAGVEDTSPRPEIRARSSRSPPGAEAVRDPLSCLFGVPEGAPRHLQISGALSSAQDPTEEATQFGHEGAGASARGPA